MKTKLIASLIAVSAIAVAPAQAETTVSTKGGLKVESGEYSFQFGGRLMYDYNKYIIIIINDDDSKLDTLYHLVNDPVS